jgi:hypothetical protein
MTSSINTALAFSISCCGYVALAYQATTYMEDYQSRIDELIEINSQLNSINNKYRVTATMYHPVSYQTDNTPTITADGTQIVDVYKAHELRYVALSRDLLKRWGGPFDYEDYIIVENAGNHSGVWQVRDTMNKRWTSRIDFLMSPSHKPFKYEQVVIRSQKQL